MLLSGFGMDKFHAPIDSNLKAGGLSGLHDPIFGCHLQINFGMLRSGLYTGLINGKMFRLRVANVLIYIAVW